MKGHQSMISLAHILDLPRYSDMQLLTNIEKSNLSQEVKSVEISETPDIEHYIPEGVLLLTTAMSYPSNQTGLISLIDSLIRAKAVGLGIKTGRFLGGQLDESVIRYAESLNFPIIDIPDSYSLGGLLHQLLNNIWGTRYEEASFALDIQNRFSDLLIQNASNEVIIQELSQMIKSPTILLDPFKELMTHSKHFNRSSNPANHYIDQIVNQVAEGNKTEGSFIIQNAKGAEIQVSLVPIKVHSYFPHYLIILNPEQIPYPISSFAIDQAAIILSFILFKNEKVAESQQTLAMDYFKEMVDYNYNSDQDLANLEPNLKFGYLISDYYQVIHVFEKNALHDWALTLYQEEQLLLSFHWLEKNISRFFKNAIVIYFTNTKDIIILVQRKYKALEENLTQIASQIQEQLPISLVFSAGNAYHNWNQINQSFTEAKLVFEERKQNQQTGLILAYEDKGITQLFNNLEKNDIKFFCKNILKDFAFPEDSTMIDLRRTLEVYLDSQCEIASTASKLFVHRNTVKYRIQRCEEILGHDVSSPEHSLNLRLALTLSKEEQSLAL